MKITIDDEKRTLTVQDGESSRELSLYTDEAFGIISDAYLKVGWNQKYVYTFSWLGRPIIQLPDDMIRMQEVIYAVRPDVIVETGVAHGGSLAFYSSLCGAMKHGRVIGVDIEIRPHNREAIEAHPTYDRIELIEASSTDPSTVKQVREAIRPGESVLVILDSNHSYAHVTDELNAYASMVSVGSYIVATDGNMRDLTDVPRGHAEWREDNPARAAEDFAAVHPDFVLEEPQWPFNESSLSRNVTMWPSAYLKRVS